MHNKARERTTGRMQESDGFAARVLAKVGGPRITIYLTREELTDLNQFRTKEGFITLSSAISELIRRGLAGGPAR